MLDLRPGPSLRDVVIEGTPPAEAAAAQVVAIRQMLAEGARVDEALPIFGLHPRLLRRARGPAGGNGTRAAASTATAAERLTL